MAATAYTAYCAGEWVECEASIPALLARLAGALKCGKDVVIWGGSKVAALVLSRGDGPPVVIRVASR
jgi:hypothetical protein